MHPDLRDRPLFICGHPKSGTSLLRALLDGHPQLVVYPEESVFFRRYFPKAQGKQIDEQLVLAEQYLIQMFTWNQDNPPPSQEGFPDRDYSTISFEEVRAELGRILSTNPARHPGDILSAAVIAFGQVTAQLTPDVKLWVEKSPYNERYVEDIFTWWPGARCLHVVRDPRDNFVSYRRKHPEWEPEFFARNWVRSSQAGLQNQARFGEDVYQLTRFEDLVQSPQETLRSICSFLDIDYRPELTQPSRAGKTWAGNSMFDQEFATISIAPVGRWRDQLDSADAAVIESITKAQIHHFNYTFSENIPLSARIRAAAWPLRRRFLKKTIKRN